MWGRELFRVAVGGSQKEVVSFEHGVQDRE